MPDEMLEREVPPIQPMTGPVGPVPDDDSEIDADVDLDELDEQLRREVVGKSTTVRIDGKVLHIMHAGDWSSSAMRAATNGDWESWAREVIIDDEEFGIWMDADLRNYQIEAVFNECGRKARMSLGKSRRPSGSRNRSRRR
jgi:hypothetical protein